MLETIRQLTHTGLAVILSTHHPEQAFACTQQAALLKEGRLIGLGPTEEALTEASLSTLYDTPLAVQRLEGWISCIPARRG